MDYNNYTGPYTNNFTYQQLIQNNILCTKELSDLKRRLLQFEEVIKMTQNLNSELQKKNENLEIENRTLEEEYNTLKDNYENMKKRFEQLQREISEIKTQASKKSSMFGWIINNGVKNENTKLKEKIEALETELNLKIQENEQIHIEIFDEKQIFDDKLSSLESEMEKMKIIINDKIYEFNMLNDNNLNLIKIQKSLESNLNQMTENMKKTEKELQIKTDKWKNKKIYYKNQIETKNVIELNMININDYRNSKLNIYNTEYINSTNVIQGKYHQSFKLFGIFIGSFINTLTPIDSLIELLIERFNYIYTNIDLKTEHRGYLFSCDKLRFHLSTLQQIIRCKIFFSKILMKNIETFKSVANIVLNINIILTLLNKADRYIELISKYYRILLKEERKISYNDFVENSGKTMINKDLKYSLSLLSGSLSVLIKKLNIILNYNVNYNFKNINIVSDNTSGMLIRISQDYFNNYKYETCLRITDKLNLIGTLLKNDFSRFKKYLNEFIQLFTLKTEIDYKIFEIIKEESKNKFNYPMFNLSAFRMNNDNIKKYFNTFNESITKFSNMLSGDYSMMAINSWEFKDGGLIINFLNVLENLDNIKRFYDNLNETYNKSQAGVEFEEALQSRTMLKEMLEKENLLSRDRENYMNKINEYDEDLRRYRAKLSEEKNINDLLRTQIKDKNFTSNCNSTVSTDNGNNVTNEFDDFVKNQINIRDIPLEILSDDVNSGKQRSSFKLSNPKIDKPIPLTKFTAQIENNQDVSVLYHRKVIQTMQLYAKKVKNMNLKVESSIRTDEIANVYEKRIKEIEDKFKDEINEYNKNIDSIISNYENKLSSSEENFKLEKDKLIKELQIKNDNLKLEKEKLQKEMQSKINDYLLEILKKNESISGLNNYIDLMSNTVVKEYAELKELVIDCSKCKNYIK